MPQDTQKWSQWDFSSLEAWEVEHCWSYEFTWHLPGLVRRVLDWREKVPKREGQDLFEAYLSHQGGRASSFIQIGGDLSMIPPGAYYLFPEWPATPYLKIPSRVRSQRLKKLFEGEKDRGERVRPIHPKVWPEQVGTEKSVTPGKREKSQTSCERSTPIPVDTSLILSAIWKQRSKHFAWGGTMTPGQGSQRA